MNYLQKLNAWVPVFGWESSHQIFSDWVNTKIKRLAIVKDGLKSRPEKILNTHVQRYENITMDDGYRNKIVRFHRMIALTYLPNPNNYAQVNHIDCNKLNNSIINLEWCTGQQNRKHAHENKLYKEGENHPRAVISNKTATEIREYAKNNLDMSQTRIGKVFGVSQHTVSRLLTYKTYKKAPKTEPFY